MNIPNAITIARMFMIPVFLVFAYADSDAAAVWATVIFVVASVSDLIDGYLARRDGTITRLGQFLDPTADKLLVGAALIVLVGTRDFPLWAALVIAVREVAVQILRTRIVSAGGTLPASPAGKLKTVVQMVMIGYWLLPIELSPVHDVLLAVGLATTLWSGAEYFMKARTVRPAA